MWLESSVRERGGDEGVESGRRGVLVSERSVSKCHVGAERGGTLGVEVWRRADVG